jgi:hypothetical protein
MPYGMPKKTTGERKGMQAVIAATRLSRNDRIRRICHAPKKMKADGRNPTMTPTLATAISLQWARLHIRSTLLLLLASSTPKTQQITSLQAAQYQQPDRRSAQVFDQLCPRQRQIGFLR